MLKTVRIVFSSAIILASLGLSVYSVYLQNLNKENIDDNSSRINLLEERFNSYSDDTKIEDLEKELDDTKLDVSKLKKKHNLK